MALDKLNHYSVGYNAYNIPSVSDNNKKVDPSNIAPRKDDQNLTNNNQDSRGQEKDQLNLDVKPVRENASIENVAISFGQYDVSSIDLFGEKGIASGDMSKAISGMQKDHILHEYQYFVGKDLTGKTNNNIIAGTEDGVVIKLG